MVEFLFYFPFSQNFSEWSWLEAELSWVSLPNIIENPSMHLFSCEIRDFIFLLLLASTANPHYTVGLHS